MNDSVFTKIIKGETPCYKIYEDSQVIAFLDLHPIAPGHTLVVPKKQIDHIWDLSEEDYDYLMNVTKKLATHIKEVLQPARVGMIVEGFGVPHTHIHLVPINEEAELRRKQDMNGPVDDEQLKTVAKALAAPSDFRI